MVSLELTPREVEVVRLALRAQEDAHKRNDFPNLRAEVENLRSKVADAIIDNSTPMV